MDTGVSIAIPAPDISRPQAEEKPDTDTKVHLGAVVTIINIVVIAVIISIGWQIRDEYFINAEYGIGYALGICGGLMMLALLIYPLKKRFSHSRLFVFSTPVWFRIHMVLGILGPLAILFHCNFSLGSTNSNVALLAMFMMVSSGLFGRYLYSRIHMGIYGKKAELAELLSTSLETQHHLANMSQQMPLRIPAEIYQPIKDFEQTALVISQYHHPLKVLTLNIESHFAFREIKQQLRKTQLSNKEFLRLSKKARKAQIRLAERQIAHLFQVIRKISGLNLFERLFSLWHMMHMPIFFMLIASAFIHVYAVHAY